MYPSVNVSGNCTIGECDNLKPIYVSYKQAKCFNEQMKQSMFSFYKLKSRLPGGKMYEDLRYEWHWLRKSMNWKCFKELVRQVSCYCFGSRITEFFGGKTKDERKRMISSFVSFHKQTLFHWTSQEKVESILDKGLHPGKDSKYVYMTDDAEYIARSGYFFFKVDQDKRDMHFVLLKIDAFGLAEKYKVFCVDAPHEYAVREVPPRYITVYR